YRHHTQLHSFPTRRSSDLCKKVNCPKKWIIYGIGKTNAYRAFARHMNFEPWTNKMRDPNDKSIEHCSFAYFYKYMKNMNICFKRSEEHTSELQSRSDLVCR